MEKIYVPPIKIQGIKTKLINSIRQNIILDNDTCWVEPFMGSGVVGFNLALNNAIFCDINPHIINFYNRIKSKEISSERVKSFLEQEGNLLAELDDKHYYYIRDRFNETGNSLDFLFLNRSCFNGMIRFNRDGKFNVPYGHKPKRFTKAYITKIINQIAYVEYKVRNSNWSFVCQSFESTLSKLPEKSFIYCDPPYIGRHVDYYDTWNEDSEIKLKQALLNTKQQFMMSTWDYNIYRSNEYLSKVWFFCNKINVNHYYHVGGSEKNRNPMVEALLVNYNCKKNTEMVVNQENYQLELPFC